MTHLSRIPTLTILFVGVLTGRASAEPKIDYVRDIRPILADHCFNCHGADEKARKAKLKLDTFAGATAKRKGPSAVVPGKPAESELVARLHTADADIVMPPPETGKPLSTAQKKLLEAWIASGAEYREHWAFTAPVKSPVPAVRDAKSVRTGIDAFVLARLEKDGLKLSREADRITLVRRLSQDLTGLPPTPAMVEAFVRDTRPDAYERLVDELIAMPQFGERMTLDWLDAARYADTHGFHIDSGRDMTRWRDWVIRAFNDNKPYDRFIVEQIAGDLLPSATLEQKIASGFNRNHMINYEGGAIPEEYLNAYIVDRVSTTATVFLGLTVACAQCHDHKYDPISHKEFYQFYAFFNTLAENGLDGQRGNAAPLLKVPTPAQTEKIRAATASIDSLRNRFNSPDAAADAAQTAWEAGALKAKVTWKPAAVTKVEASGGGIFAKGADDSWTVSGANPAKDNYSVWLPTDNEKITGLRVEFLPGESNPSKWLGRSNNGNFVMTNVRVFSGKSAEAANVTVRATSADFSQDTFPADQIGKPSSKGWAIYPQVDKPHTLSIEVDGSKVAADGTLRVDLEFQSQFAQHSAARIRVSRTDSPSPLSADAIPPGVVALLGVEADKRTPGQAASVKAYYRRSVSPEMRQISERIDAEKKALAELEAKVPDAMVMADMPNPRDTFIRVRGQYDLKGDKVMPATLAVLPPLKPAGARANRLDLANWLVRDEHPLTARVTVNRFWQVFFGTGLVKTSEDFGTQGEAPSHPELLDTLAVEFRESGWDIKKLVRTIVLSSVYRQESRTSPEVVKRDPENRLLARSARLRLPVEFIRDQALTVSGLLNPRIGGESVSPYQPKGIWEELTFRQDNASFSAQIYAQSKGADLYRRTMYTFWKRTAPPPTLVAMDAPDRETCTVRRPRTNTPLQALILMNDPTYVEAARKLAERTLRDGGATTETRLEFVSKLVLSRSPSAKEVSVLKGMLDFQTERFAASPEAAKKLLAVGESARDDKLDASQLAAWTMLANAMLNLDEAITRN